MKFIVSIATAEDIELLVDHRLKMLREIFPQYAPKAQNIEGQTREWIKTKMAQKKLIGFIARTQEGHAAGSGCIWLRETQPSMISPFLEAPYLMSIYTEESFRRNGVAKLITQTAIEWCKANGYDRINLHASESGRSVYETLGFEPTSEMRLWLD